MRLLISIFFYCLLLSVTACTSATKQDINKTAFSKVTTSKTPPETFKVLTYNVWHGLHVGPFWVTLTESPEEQKARFQRQVNQMARAAPDIILLQEVNPLPKRAEEYVEALNEFGLEYTEVHQVDACGLRLSRKKAIIPDLNNGLVTLVKKEYRLNRIQGLKILGGFGMCRSTRGFQLKEMRYALIAEVTWPGSGAKYLVANVHKHAGYDASIKFLQQVKELTGEDQSQLYSKTKKPFKDSQRKRKKGLIRLMEALNRLREDGGYAGILLGGDFNFEPSSSEYKKALELGLLDTHEIAIRDGELYTLDPIGNDLILDGDEPIIPQLLSKAISRASRTDQAAILAAYQEDMKRPKRIDYIFVDSFLPNARLRQELFGLDKGPDGLPASDHYGVLNIYSLNQIGVE
jgi:endonuclease/exonuclease/phosphatase family metal-dependent hydrolase